MEQLKPIHESIIELLTQYTAGYARQPCPIAKAYFEAICDVIDHTEFPREHIAEMAEKIEELLVTYGKAQDSDTENTRPFRVNIRAQLRQVGADLLARIGGR